MKCDCETQWKGNYKHSLECAKKRVAWWVRGIKDEQVNN
jgi:hypothetical protein